jgi:hypothetical protein
MLARLWEAQVPIAWVVADTVYGSNLDLRTWLEDCRSPYVLAVACNEPVGILTSDGLRRRVEAAQVEMFLLEAHDWQRLSMSEDRRGKRLFDWASVPILHRWEDDGCHWLLLRRSLTDPTEKAYSFVFAPKGTTLPEMVSAGGAGFHIEEHFENGKDLGLDHYEVRGFDFLVPAHHAGAGGSCRLSRDLCDRAVLHLCSCCSSASRSTCRACGFPSQKCAICLHSSSGPLLHLPGGFWPGRGGEARIKVRPALTTPNEGSRLANSGCFAIFHR